MIRVLILDPTGLNPATHWRLYGPFNRIARDYEGEITVRYSDGRGLLLQELALFDVVVFYITLNEGITQLVEAAKNQGCKIILDCDDDVFNLDPSTPEWQDYHTQQNHLTHNFRLADEIWFSTDALRDSYHNIGPNRYTMPNAVDPALLPTEPKPIGKEITALWRGSASHQIDYFSGQYWYESETDVDKWIWFGYLPPYAKRDKQNRFLGRVPPERFLSTLQAQPFQFLWKPLKECRQNDGKSNISWIEATLSGAVCVTNYAGKPGFEDCLDTFSPGMAKYTWEVSADRIVDEYSIFNINELRVNRLHALVGKNFVTI